MHWKLFLIFLALVAESTFARLQGHHRRHTHGHHHGAFEKRLDPNVHIGGGVAIGPLTATLGVDVPKATVPPTKPHGGAHHPHHTGPDGGENPHGKPQAHPLKSTANWDQLPPHGDFSFDGFGERTPAHGDGVSYVGNVGNPWGSNMIVVKDPKDAPNYKYVAQIHGSKNKNDKVPWTMVFWNKIGPDGKMTGWYGHSALNFTIHPDQVVYVAFDENSQGGWSAAPGDHLPIDQYGGYSSTWGEFDVGSKKNGGLSGWDVSCIQAQNAKQPVQGMSICLSNGDKCSSIEVDARKVDNAYTNDKAGVDGLGGIVSPGAVRLMVELDYQG